MHLNFGLLRIYLIDLFGGTNILNTYKKFKKEELLSKDQLNLIRQDRLNNLFQQANSSTKYYKNVHDYYEIKFLEKHTIRNNFKDFISTSYKKKMHPKSTGGSTGIPLNYFSTNESRSAIGAIKLLLSPAHP